MAFCGRTDLASEAHRLWRQSAGPTYALPGVRAEERQHGPFSVTEVEILDDRGRQALGKPPGLYFTLELTTPFSRDRDLFPRAAALLGELLARCFPFQENSRVLIAALGNPDITPDAVGPLAASHLLVTRHLKQDPAFSDFASAALCRTGVLGTTGLESALQVQCLCRSLSFDCVLVVDALAGARADRLCRSIQICDTGIAPGSGVGNDRPALTVGTLGVPVLAVGVPTVIDAALLSGEASLAPMFVTPRDIDSQVRLVSRLIAYGINLALHRGLTVEDIDLLLG